MAGLPVHYTLVGSSTVENSPCATSKNMHLFIGLLLFKKGSVYFAARIGWQQQKAW